MPETDWLFHPMVDTPLGGPLALGAAGTTTVTALATVPADSIGSFSVITDSFVSATRLPESPAVPEPVTAGLGLMGLSAMATRPNAAAACRARST